MNYAYADSNLFIAYFNNETGRADILDQLFEEIELDPKRKLLTPVFTITEVSKLATEKLGHPLAVDFESRSDGIWKNMDLIEMADVSETVARRARKLIREFMPQGLKLSAADSIHLATAQVLSVPIVLTYDTDLLRFATALGLAIQAPSINQPRLF